MICMYITGSQADPSFDACGLYAYALRVHFHFFQTASTSASRQQVNLLLISMRRMRIQSVIYSTPPCNVLHLSNISTRSFDQISSTSEGGGLTHEKLPKVVQYPWHDDDTNKV